MRARGADAPVLPGVMPITNVRQVERMAAMSGTSIPDELGEKAARRGGPSGRGASSGRRARDAALPSATRRRCARAALLHDEPRGGDRGGVRQSGLGVRGGALSVVGIRPATVIS